MDKKYENLPLKNAKLAALNQRVVSLLVNKTFTEIDYQGEFYIQTAPKANLFEISVPTCQQDDDLPSFDYEYTHMYYRILVYGNQVAYHQELFDYVLKALVDYDLPCNIYLQVAEAFQDGVLLEPKPSYYTNFLEKAIKKDAKQCIKWMIESQKQDKTTLRSLLKETENFVREGHSFSDLGVTPDAVKQLGLDCIEPAVKGDANALYRLGLLYHQCEYEYEDWSQKIFMQLVERDEPLGYSGMSECLFNEYLPASKQIKDIKYHIMAADNGDLEAMYRCGYILTRILPSKNSKLDDWQKGVHYLELAANQKHTNASFLLGRIYYQGTYLPKDLDKATTYLIQAAENGHVEASALVRIIESQPKVKDKEECRVGTFLKKIFR